MHFAVIYYYAYIAHIRTGKRTFLHFFHHTFLYGRNKTLVNHTTYNAIVENHLATPSQIKFFFVAYAYTLRLGHAFMIRFNLHIHFSELPCATALFLVTVRCLCLLLNRFPIWNPR